jgi:hypothetical protein
MHPNIALNGFDANRRPAAIALHHPREPVR